MRILQVAHETVVVPKALHDSACRPADVVPLKGEIVLLVWAQETCSALVPAGRPVQARAIVGGACGLGEQATRDDVEGLLLGERHNTSTLRATATCPGVRRGSLR